MLQSITNSSSQIFNGEFLFEYLQSYTVVKRIFHNKSTECSTVASTTRQASVNQNPHKAKY